MLGSAVLPAALSASTVMPAWARAVLVMLPPWLMPAFKACICTSPPTVVRRTLLTCASTSLLMLLKASDKPIATDTATPPPASEAASAAAPAIASMLARLSTKT